MAKEISKTYNPQENEDKIYEIWEKSGYFNPDKCVVDKITEKEAFSFSIIMPPPNATGFLHMGSAMMLAIEDVMVRYYRMQGRRTLWLPGTDHAAIATQNRVEKNLRKEGIDRHSLGREEFLKRVDDFVENSRNVIRTQMRKMGASCDWSREAFTLDETRTKAVRTIFKMMYDDGLIYRGERVVNWCPRCHSTIADDEVEYKKQKTFLYTFKYSKDFPFVIATTRTETKLGDTAVAVNPNDERYKKYIGKVYEADFCGVKLKLKIIVDRNVDMNFGTGALGVTPAHSMIDWQMAQANNLEAVKVINEDGKIREGFGEFSGKNVEDARKLIVEKLKSQGLLEKEEEVENNLSVCYRCETAVEPLPSLQWFINVNKKIPRCGKSIKELSINAVKKGIFGRKKIEIIPSQFEKNYFNWMENLYDWCISRQIWYGHRIPVWYKNLNGKEEIYVGAEAPKGEGWIQDEDTLDTWFSSGLWTFSTMASSPFQIEEENGKIKINNDDFKIYHPTSILETMYDILFFWVARMIIMTTYAVEDIPFQKVYLHGCVRDKFGDKMSKSKPETCIDPLDVCERYGTDAVRLSLIIGATPGNDTRVSEEKIAGFRNFTNKLWNISRYILSSSEFKRLDGEFEDNLTLSDKWILNRLDNVINETTTKLENYEFSQAGEILREFSWGDFADWYLEIAKIEENKDEILSYILENLLKLWHPFMPFVTEVIWQELGNKMLMIEKWPAKGKTKKNNIKEEFNLIKNIVTLIRNARAQYKINPSHQINAIIYGGEKKELIKSQEDLIKRLRTGIENLEVKEGGEKVKNAIYLTIGGVEIYLIVPDFDFKAEIGRLEKEIKDKELLIKNLSGRLSNKDFAERAPEEIIVKEKDKLIMWNEELEKMKEQLDHLR